AAQAAHRRRELATQTARDRAEVPLVEVAHQDARPRKLMRDRDEAAEEIELAPALAGVEAEVTDEDVQRRAADLDVDAQAAARLATAPAQVAARGARDGKPRQHRVAVRPASVRARLAHHERHAETIGEERGLVGVGM